jgi:hypothetical protein
MRCGTYAAPYLKPDPEMEKQLLKEGTEVLQAQLDSIRKRLEEIESRPAAQEAAPGSTPGPQH